MDLQSSGRLGGLAKMAGEIVQPYTGSLEQKHAGFVDQAWPGSRARKDANYLAWKFNSGTSDKIEGLLLAIKDGIVLGQLGLIPVKVKVGECVADAQWGCNFKVLPELEGAGYGSLLDIRSTGMKTVTLGANPSKQSEDLKIRLGFKALEGPRIMAYPLDFIFFLKLKFDRYPGLIAVLAYAWKLSHSVRHWKNYWKPKGGLNNIKQGSYTDVIQLIQKCRDRILIPHVVHDAEFLRWRCGEVPSYRTETRSLSMSSGSFILYYPTNKYCYLYEYHFANSQDQRLLLRELLQIASQSGSKILYVYVNEAGEERPFRKFGFIGFKTKVKVYAYSADPTLEFGSRFHMNVYDSDGNL